MGKIKVFSVIFTLIALILFSYSCNSSGSDKFKVNPEPKIQEALKGGKYLMIIVESADCRYCEKLNKEVLNDQTIKEKLIKNNVVVAIVNAYGNRKITDPQTKKEMEEEAFALAYRVQGFPTIIVFDPTKNFEMLTYINGYIPKSDFANLLDYIGTGCYKKTDYENFIRNNKKC
ncbi:MAG: peptide permease [Persephonella sp.]|nr:MAG: peptide permease [Persephonella sp.]